MGKDMKGTLLGLLSMVLDPLAFLLVPLFAIRGKYPWWMLTPDDTVSPFGMYEEAMRKAYKKGRWWGDVVWLACRNRFYGLLFSWKPQELYPYMDVNLEYNYRHFEGEVKVGRFWTTYTIRAPLGGKYKMVKIPYFAGRGGMFGWKVDSMVTDPLTPRRYINMEGRPIFSPLRVIH